MKLKSSIFTLCTFMVPVLYFLKGIFFFKFKYAIHIIKTWGIYLTDTLYSGVFLFYCCSFLWEPSWCSCQGLPRYSSCTRHWPLTKCLVPGAEEGQSFIKTRTQSIYNFVLGYQVLVANGWKCKFFKLQLTLTLNMLECLQCKI